MAGNIKKVGYATYPSVKLQAMETDPKTGKTKFTFIKELLFGDYMSPIIEDGDYVTKTVTSSKKTEEYIKVHCRNADGWIKRSEMQFDRPLEVNFIDVGQGDGCHIVTPDDKHFLIDAGKSDNMYRFLKWRFNLRSPGPLPGIRHHLRQVEGKGAADPDQEGLPQRHDRGGRRLARHGHQVQR